MLRKILKDKFELTDNNDNFEIKINGVTMPKVTSYSIEANGISRHINLNFFFVKEEVDIHIIKESSNEA